MLKLERVERNSSLLLPRSLDSGVSEPPPSSPLDLRNPPHHEQLSLVRRNGQDRPRCSGRKNGIRNETL